MKKATKEKGFSETIQQEHLASLETSIYVYEIKKNATEVIRFTPQLYKGSDVLDIRVYATTKSGEVVPTRKGLTVSTKHVEDLITGLQKVKFYLDERNL